MGRAPNPGAPQRVSAHVVPKAQPFSEDEEKTTIESGWEEEASTTLEEGDVASRIRALNGEVARARNNTGITNTNGSGVEEPTVDDQRANALISMITPPSMSARLLITQGNDSGQDLEVIPGKSYTIGRAIENDFVLTDIAVSRKHFDLRFEGGSWLLADRGSGNGTLVNGNIEDQPFLLANGDLIEIGNTTFRFEQAGGTPRPAAGTYDISVDEDEPSTLAGKPLRSADEIATPSHVPPSKRPKTVPPPAPLPRARSVSSTAPPLAYPSGSQTRPPMPGMPPARSQPQPVLPLPSLPQPVPIMPASTLPMPQMANRPPLAPPNAPTMLADSGHGMQNAMPTTIPGQGPPLQMQPLPYGYPNLADMHKQQHGPMLVVGHGPGRDATSTALVQPAPYGVMSAAQQLPPRQGRMQLSRRTRLTLAAAGLAVLAAVATIAIIKGASSGKKDDAPKSDPLAGEAAKVAAPAETTAKAEPKQPAPRPVPKVEPKVEPPKPEPPRPEQPKVEAPRPEPPKPEPQKAEPQKIDVDPPKAEPPPKPEPEVAKADPPKADPPPRVRADTRTKPDPRRRNTTARTSPPARDPPKADPPAEPKTDPAPKRIAVADSSEAKSRANELYRAKRFNDAGQLLRKAAAGMPADATDLRSIASVYEQVGRAYNRGMAPAAKPVEAFAELRKALNLDSGSAGGAFKEDIQGKLSQVAPRAAISFFGSKDYESAYQALRTAEQFGSTSGDLKLVRQGLEAIAVQLYNAASKEIGSNPEEAKTKLRQVKAMVDPKSATWVKANKLLTSG